MGESSYKAMRGGGMEDVIFSGSGSRPSRNMAEVTLGAERDEGTGNGPEPVEITRRIERDSGSSYRINGREVRARDVQILFADASTGAHSSALVRQGQVAELIAAKPIARRGILEDAAGISGLHARRNEAEQKLRAAETNLNRLHRRHGRDREPARRAEAAGAAGGALSQDFRGDPPLRGDPLRHQLGERARPARRGGGGACRPPRRISPRRRPRRTRPRRPRRSSAERLPALRDKAAAAAAALERLKTAAAEIDREEEQRKARREELIGRRAAGRSRPSPRERDRPRRRRRRRDASTRRRRSSAVRARKRRGQHRRAPPPRRKPPPPPSHAWEIGIRRRRGRACRRRRGARGARARDPRGAGEASPAGGRARDRACPARPHRGGAGRGSARSPTAAAALAEAEALVAEREREAEARGGHLRRGARGGAPGARPLRRRRTRLRRA